MTTQPATAEVAKLESMERDTVPIVSSDNTGKNSRDHFEQYLYALELTEEAWNAAFVAPSSSIDEDSLARFEQYLYALELTEQNAVPVVLPASTGKDSWTRFEQYSAAIESMEWNAVASPIRIDEDSMAYFEQYLEHAK